MKRFTFQRVLIAAALALGILATSAGNVRADNYTIQWSDSGWYDNSGFHNSSNKNYLSGFVAGFGFFNNYFVFDLAGVSGTVVGAQLRLYNPDQAGDQFPYAIYDVSTPIPTLSADQSDATSIYSDLGSGVLLGQNDGPFADDTIVEVNLNAAGLAYIQAALGNLIAFGGRYNPAGVFSDLDSYLFGFSGSPGDVRELVIVTRNDAVVPAPAGILLSGMGLVSLGGFTWLRRRKIANSAI